MTDTSPEAVERLAARLVAEEGHYQKVFDLVVLYRDRNTGGPFADLNNVKHALSGRDPVLLEAADMLRALAAKLAEAEAALATAREDTLREAASECQRLAGDPRMYNSDRRRAAGQCAAAILALIENTSTKEKP